MRLTRTLLIVMLAASGHALAACGNGGGEPAADIAVEGSWRLESYLDGDQMKPLLPGSEVTANFGTENVSGSAGVNDYTASYSLDGDAIDLGRITVTEDAGFDEVAGQERAFLEDLDRAREYSVEDGRLSLRTKKGVVLLTFVRGLELELVGAWTCTGYADGKGGLAAPQAGGEPSADFGEEGAVSGFDGAASYTGSYETTAANGLVISDLESLDGEAERTPGAERFTDALRAAASYELGDAALTLVDAEGETVATFVSAE